MKKRKGVGKGTKSSGCGDVSICAQKTTGTKKKQLLQGTDAKSSKTHRPVKKVCLCNRKTAAGRSWIAAPRHPFTQAKQNDSDTESSLSSMSSASGFSDNSLSDSDRVCELLALPYGTIVSAWSISEALLVSHAHASEKWYRARSSRSAIRRCRASSWRVVGRNPRRRVTV